MGKVTPLDLSSPENCRAFLIEKFSDLLQGIDALYGRELMELLIARLEQTIALFHQDVQQLLAEIRGKRPVTEGALSNPTPQEVSSIPATNMDEWGKHLY
jgi:hypothetical protein